MKEKIQTPEEFLESFKSVKELRDYLVKEEFKGIMKDGSNCPIANCLKKNFPGIVFHYIDESWLVFYQDPTKHKQFTPKIAKEFITQFDNFEIPELSIGYDTIEDN